MCTMIFFVIKKKKFKVFIIYLFKNVIVLYEMKQKKKNGNWQQKKAYQFQTKNKKIKKQTNQIGNIMCMQFYIVINNKRRKILNVFCCNYLKCVIQKTFSKTKMQKMVPHFFSSYFRTSSFLKLLYHIHILK